MKNEIESFDEMRKLALCAMNNAYKPYSDFAVGCCVSGASGKLYSGCNVENSSFGATMCAERNAIGVAIACGEKEITRLYNICSKADMPYPCGICRQVIAEFAGKGDVEIVVENCNGQVSRSSLSQLLPNIFKI